MTDKPQLAVLIDADNVSVDLVQEALGLASQHGDIRRICAYRDWKHAGDDWNALVARHAIHQVQQFACANRKNASDISLTIDAMDYLYKGIRAFCLMSGDSDFTPLALRLRRGGARVYGFGGSSTPQTLRQACDAFHEIGTSKARKVQALARSVPLSPFDQLVKTVIAEGSLLPEGDFLAAFGKRLRQHKPDFKPNQFGHGKLKTLVSHSQILDLHTDGDQQVRVRLKGQV